VARQLYDVKIFIIQKEDGEHSSFEKKKLTDGCSQISPEEEIDRRRLR
jgi:hypothetical protein